MKRIVRLTERDLSRIVRRVIKEDAMKSFVNPCQKELDALSSGFGVKIPPMCSAADGQNQCIKDLLNEVKTKLTLDNAMSIMAKYNAYVACNKENGIAAY
jgi:hypothetical protein